MKEVFKNNRIYPFHFMYDTGLLEEIKDVVLAKKHKVDHRTRGIVSDWTDRQIEKLARGPGRAIWREMKRGARRPFRDGMAGFRTVRAFLEAFALAKPHAGEKKIHLVGHSTGAILLAALLEACRRDSTKPLIIQTCALMAPACTHDTFNQVYRPLIEEDVDHLRLDRLTIYNLTDALERADTVAWAYRKSLLYLVSNSFEETTEEHILGMQKFRRHLGRGLPTAPRFRIEVSNGLPRSAATTASTKHDGFDNDPFTMNDILHSILNAPPARSFTQDDLEY